MLIVRVHIVFMLITHNFRRIRFTIFFSVLAIQLIRPFCLNNLYFGHHQIFVQVLMILWVSPNTKKRVPLWYTKVVLVYLHHCYCIANNYSVIENNCSTKTTRTIIFNLGTKFWDLGTKIFDPKPL